MSHFILLAITLVNLFQPSVASCGGQLTGESGFVSSPNYPGNYPSKLRCEWIITVDQGSTIRFDFSTPFDFKGCLYDYIEISEIHPNGTVIRKGKWCGSTVPPSITSSTSKVRVFFRSDGLTSHKGFLATWRKVGSCQQQLTGNSGYASSPNFPLTFFGNAKSCSWTITVDQEDTIRLDFYPPFNLRAPCSYASVKVFEVEPNGGRYLRGTWCGTTMPPSLTSSTSKVEVELTAKRDDHAEFFFVWKKETAAACSSYLGNVNGSIASPNYPSSYPNNLNSRWCIAAPLGQFVVLTFNSTFDLGNVTDTECPYDKIKVSDLLSETNSLVSQGEWCGKNIPPVIRSLRSTLVIDLYTDNEEDNNGQGFYATWTFEDICGGVLEAEEGHIMSYKYKYAINGHDVVLTNSLTCSWDIIVPEGSRISLNFDPPINSTYCKDFQIGDYSPEIGIFNPLQKWCSEEFIDHVTSLHNRMKVVFTQSKNNTDGFFALWKSICGAVLSTADGNVTSPNYPFGYGNDVDCRWEINRQTNNAMTLTFDSDFEMEYSEDCDYDYVQVFDAGEGTLVNRGKFCGHNAPKALVSLSSKVVVIFHSDGSKHGKGFSVSWKSGIDAEHYCGDVYNSTRGHISFPSVQEPFFSNMTCQWHINTRDPWYHFMRVTFQGDFGIGKLTLSSGGHTFMVFHNQLQVGPFLLETSDLVLTLKSDGQTPGNGFNISWDAVCKEIVTGTNGVIKSPSQQGEYLPNMDCEWEIHGIEDHVIHLNFDSPFDLEFTYSCLSDYVEVFDYLPNATLVSLGKFCGNRGPVTQVSSSDRMVVRFHSDQYKSGRGFTATWDTDCGEVYESNSGSLASPLSGSHYPNAIDCRWKIKVTEGYVIRLDFTQFSLEDDGICHTDYVELFDVLQNGTLESKGKWCGDKSPKLQISKTSNLGVVFHSDQSKTASGFRAEWYSVCGDVYQADQGVLTSPNYPHDYPNNAECRWEIIVSPGQRINLTFDATFDLELDNDGCGYDYLQVYDYLSNGTSLSNSIWCGNQKPVPITSLSSKVTVTFHSDQNKNGKGFRMFWQEVDSCNYTFNKNEGYLTSPNYPNLYPTNQLCRWEINPKGDTNVTLMFHATFDIEASNVCAWDYVEIVQGSDIIGRYCGNTQPPPLTFNNEPIVVIFKSDKSNNGKGFLATWKSS